MSTNNNTELANNFFESVMSHHLSKPGSAHTVSDQ